MATIVKDHTFTDGTAARPEQMNANFDTIVTVINGNIDWDNLKASLVNAANGILKLDASGDVPLGQIPDTLTGKDADTVDTKHYSDITTKIAADIATHKAISSAHHVPTDPTAAIAVHTAIAAAHHARYTDAEAVTAVSVVTDHGALTGLTDDDHTQYIKKTPDYDSGWASINQSEAKVFTHSLGITNLLVQVYGKEGGGTIHNLNWSYPAGGAAFGYYWLNLTTTAITVRRGVNDTEAAQVRVRLWKLS